MNDFAVIRALAGNGVKHCLIGAHAFSVWGYTRNTVDIDFITVDDRVLSKRFWPEDCVDHIVALRRGDDDDPLVGVARFKDPAIDVIVGRGRLVREAITTATLDDITGVPVATPLHLSLLKLDAGGPKDIADVCELFAVMRVTGSDPELQQRVAERVPELSAWGQGAWARLVMLTAGARRGQDG